jgi:hypothetical protein
LKNSGAIIILYFSKQLWHSSSKLKAAKNFAKTVAESKVIYSDYYYVWKKKER